METPAAWAWPAAPVGGTGEGDTKRRLWLAVIGADARL